MTRNRRSSVDNALTRPERDKLKAFIREKGTPKDLLTYYCLVEWGLRVSEFAHFRESWLERDRGLIRIPTSQECECSECRKVRKGYWFPKSKAGIRTIPAKKISERLGSDAWDFVTKYFELEGNPPSNRKRIWARIAELGRLAKIEKIVFPHALRATAALSISTISGMTASGLMSIMGWSRLETANRYIQASGVEVERIFEGTGS